jgi:hypothetical protein
LPAEHAEGAEKEKICSPINKDARKPIIDFPFAFSSSAADDFFRVIPRIPRAKYFF